MIPFFSFQPELEQISSKINHKIVAVINSGWYVLGQETELFEQEFAQYIGVKYAISVNSGSDALLLALRASGVKTGDEVITTSHTFISTADAIVRNGAQPVFVDINASTYLLDIDQIESKITKKTKAILPVHLYGSPVNMEPLMHLANKYHLKIIEDACQAHGAWYKHQKVGSIGDLGCFSFYPTKNLGTYGDGGIITTNNPALAKNLKQLRNYGQPQKYYHDQVGINSRLDEVQAAVLRIKLRYLDKWNLKRQKLAKQYTQLLKDTDIITPNVQPDSSHVFHLYVIRTQKRDQIQQHLKNRGIATQIHYPVPIHKQKAYKTISKNISLPTTEQICSQLLSLPLFPGMTNLQVNSVVHAIKEVI